MREQNRRTLATLVIVAAVLLGALTAHPAAAQERPAPVGELAAGVLLFADGTVVKEGFIGGDLHLRLNGILGVRLGR